MPKVACTMLDANLNKVASFHITPKTGWALLKVYAALKVRSAYDNDSLRGGAKASFVRCPSGTFLHMKLLEGKDESNFERRKNALLASVLQGEAPAEIGWLAFEPHGRRKMRKAGREAEAKISASLGKITNGELSFEYKLAKGAVMASGIVLFPVQSAMHGKEWAALLKEKLIYKPIENALVTLCNANAVKD